MSGAEERERARDWLAEQAAQLDGLRNANPRDPSFKHWRQNTLTVLQRIWPHEPYRSERFRRITFSPATAKPAGQLVRECFTRGCNEANEYLATLIEEVEIVGVPQPSERRPGDDFDESDAEDGVPIVDLDAPPTPTPPPNAPSPAYAMEDNVLDLGHTPSTPTHGADSPQPPALKVALRPLGERSDVDTHAPAPRVPAPKLVPPTDRRAPADPGASLHDPGGDVPLVLPSLGTGPVAAPEGIERTPVRPGATPPAKRPAKPAKAKKASPKAKLKNLLGFDHLDPIVTGHAPEASAPTPGPSPTASTPAPSAPTPTAAPTPPAATTPKPTPAAPTPAAATATPPRPATPPAPVAPVASAPAAPEPPSEPNAESNEPAYDAETLSRATQDFMRNSPVLGLQGKPVQRATDVTQFLDPDAVAVATLAADIARFGIDESARGTLRATLLELAADLDQGHPSWAALRRAVSDAMEHPELARRLVPVLLPWFERAA